MSILKDITSEKVNLQKAVFKSSLGKKITSEILFPILDELENNIPLIMEDAAIWVKDKIVSYLHNFNPTGRTYKIYEYDPNAKYGERLTLIDEYKASAPGEPPTELTGTLLDSIDYELFSDGSFKVGLLKDWGEFSDAGTELRSYGFFGGKLLVGSGGSETPVGTYGRALELGYNNSINNNFVRREWFNNYFSSIRQELRERIRKNVKKSLNKITRRVSVRRAIIFKVYFK